MSLSLCIVTKNSEAYVERLLRIARPIADELVIAVDRSSADATETICSRYADKLFRIDPIGVVEWVLAWLNAQCSGDWILRLDDDELPSASLMAALPGLLSDREVTHYWLPRRWLLGADRASWIAQRPWWPDWQLRLFRNISSIVYVPGYVHTGYVVQGAGRFSIETPIYHQDLVLRTREQLAAKVERYRRLAPDNDQAQFYLVPDRASLIMASLPPEDRASVAPVTADGPGSPSNGSAPESARPAVLGGALARNVTSAETRAYALRECEDGPGLYRATLECAWCPREMTTGQFYWVELRLRNESTCVWPVRPLGISDENFRADWLRAAQEMYEFYGLPWPIPGLIVPRVRVSYHWLRTDREVYQLDGVRTEVPHTLRPGEVATLVAQVSPPGEEGDFILQWDLVIENVAWFSEQGWTSPEFLVRVTLPAPSEPSTELLSGPAELTMSTPGAEVRPPAESC